jgi:septal ring factor EnvC (AmiA/AmiB activator)
MGLAVGAPGLHGQPTANERPAPRVERLREEAEALQLDLQAQETDLERIGRQQEDILTALDRTNQMLQRHRRRAAALNAEMNEMEQRIASTGAAMVDLAGRIRHVEDLFSRRLVALYKATRLGNLQHLAPAASVVETIKSQNAIERILSYDEHVRQTMQAQYDDLLELQAQLTRDREDQRARMAEQQQLASALQRERSWRETLLARIRDQRALQRTAIEAMKEAARELEAEIQMLSRQSAEKVAPPPAPSQPLAASKGLLIFPVKGKIQQRFGPYRHPRLNLQGFRNGIEIGADQGEPVRAVHAGTVLYASWFKAYGNIVVIDHGEHYYTVYAHLEDVFKSVDHRVEAGDVIATVGDSGAMGATSLYFEIRHYDRPLDPLEWLNRG